MTKFGTPMVALVALLASGPALAGDVCTLVALRDVASIEDPTTMMGRGGHQGAITQYRVDQGSGVASFCQHGGSCWPETVSIDGRQETATKLTNCAVDRTQSSAFDGKVIYWLVPDRQKIGRQVMRESDVADQFVRLGLCLPARQTTRPFTSESPPRNAESSPRRHSRATPMRSLSWRARSQGQSAASGDRSAVCLSVQRATICQRLDEVQTMARSTQRELAVLLRQAREHLGVRTNAEVWPRIAEAQQVLKAMVREGSDDALSVTFVSPYKDGAWTVNYVASAGPGSVADISLYPDLAKVIQEPEAMARTVIEDARRRGLLPEPTASFGPGR
jgi:hypothetical protein